ncbi:MAG: nitroreductase [Rickettsiales bacterium]|nr:nitroreductase [Rickettsiales bacterium]
MKLQDAIHSRRTAHSWTNEPVNQDILERALRAAQMAPCHRLTWPWRFTLPGPVARNALYELGVQLKAARRAEQPSEALRDRLRQKLLHPALVVVSQVLDEDLDRQNEDYAACACAIQNLSLSVTADGLHSKWSTGGLTRHKETYEILSVPQDEERIIGFVWIGTPARLPNEPERLPLEQVVRSVP